MGALFFLYAPAGRYISKKIVIKVVELHGSDILMTDASAKGNSLLFRRCLHGFGENLNCTRGYMVVTVNKMPIYKEVVLPGFSALSLSNSVRNGSGTLM